MKVFITILLVLAAITADAQYLFRISEGGLENPSYVLGTMHTLPGSVLDTIPEYAEAEAQCRQLYGEYDINDKQKMENLTAAGLQTISLPDGKTIFDVMSKDQIDLLNAKMKDVFNVNLTDSALMSSWNYQPMAFLMTFNMLFTMEEMSKHPELGMIGQPIDAVCMSRATERGMLFGQLDEIKSQDSLEIIRDSLSQNISEQVDSLINYLNNLEQHKQRVAEGIETAAQSVTFWKTGDYDSFANSEFWLSEIEKSPAIYKLRNEKWLPKMQDAMNKAPTMFVFGAGHLIGEHGIIKMLRNAGYKVEQVKR